jgi:hypothetical protein
MKKDKIGRSKTERRLTCGFPEGTVRMIESSSSAKFLPHVTVSDTNVAYLY